MKKIFMFFFLLCVMSAATLGQVNNSDKDQEIKGNIIALEKRWNDGIKSRDVALMEQFLADGYFLAIGVKGRPLTIVPRKNWLANLPTYKIESYSIDDIRVGVYGKTAVVLMVYTQKAKVGLTGEDRSAQFVITDVWTKTKKGWRVAERHSSRPEQ